ncbi:MAG TPA: archease [Gemmatimonadales bacterium]|nr:archease [Gemmatimonadales bacterium]
MTRSARRQPSHTFADHTADARLIIRSPTLAGVFTEAGRALARLEGVTSTGRDGDEWRLVEVTAADPAALLIEWLNELIYLAERDRWVATEFEIEAATPTSVRCRARGVVLPQSPARAKAATWHGVRFEGQGGRYTAEVVIDV